MIKIKLSKKSYWENQVEAYVIFVNENFKSDVDLDFIDKELKAGSKEILKKHKFEGKVNQSYVLTDAREGKLYHFIFVGLGKQDGEWHRELEHLRRAVGSSVSNLKRLEIKSAVLNIPQNKIFNVDSSEVVKNIVVTSHMADYEFETFKSKKDKNKKWGCDLFLCGEDDKKISSAIEEGEVIAESINLARNLSDLPPNIATPTFVADEAVKVAKEVQGLKCTVFGRKEAEEYGMGGFLSVDEGSDEEGKFVVLEYSCGDKKAQTVGLVGKGVTFDSGGISLKPAEYMTGMKFDMSGASAVIGTMRTIAKLKPNINVVAACPLVENMPSGRCNKQDNIVTFMNGKTAEIINTDAEGRLILADGLCYLEKFYKPEIMIDIATLTGACLYAIGHTYTGLMTTDKQLSEDIQNSGLSSGDLVWELPMNEDFKNAIKSQVADISNCGSPKYKASTITAAWFLSNFVEKSRWAHLDIAGTADGVPGVNYLGSGATGVGVRLLVDFVMNLKK